MKTNFKFFVFLVIVSMVLAACGPATKAEIAPTVIPQDLPNGDYYVIYAPGQIGADEIFNSSVPIVLAVSGVAAADDLTVWGVANDPLAVSVVVAIVAYTACTASETCRGAMVVGIEGAVDYIHSIAPAARVAVIDGWTAAEFNPRKGTLHLWDDYTNASVSWMVTGGGGCKYDFFGAFGPQRYSYFTTDPCSRQGIVEAINVFLKELGENGHRIYSEMLEWMLGIFGG